MATPQITKSVEDTNEAMTALTGSSARLVRYWSNAKITFSVAANGNTLVKAEVRWDSGGMTRVKSFLSSGNAISGTVTIENVRISQAEIRLLYKDESNTEWTFTSTVNWTLIPWFEPEVSTRAERVGSDMSQIKLTASGRCWYGNFGNAQNTLRIRFRRENESTVLATIPAEIGPNGEFSVSTTLEGPYDPTISYVFETGFMDATMGAYSYSSRRTTVTNAIPVFAVFERHFDVIGDLHLHDRDDMSQMAVVKQGDMARIVGLHVQWKEGVITTPPNNGMDLTINWDKPMPSGSYWIGITMKGNPDGFDKVAYTVSSQDGLKCVIHSWNDYSQDVRQELLVIAISC